MACNIDHCSFDIDLPTECDDEYWEDPVNPFIQPADQPSKVQHFTQFIKLCIILGNTQRTIVSRAFFSLSLSLSLGLRC